MKHFYTWAMFAAGILAVPNFGAAQAITHTIAEIQGELFSSPLVGQSVTTTGIVTANNVTSSTSGVIGYFVQDGEGPWNGVFVYDNTQAPEIGDEIILEAEVQEFYDVTELGNISYYETVSSGNELPAASVVSTGELASSEAYEGCLVQVINAVCTNPDADYGEALFDDGSGEIKTNDYMYIPEDGWVLDETYSITGCIHYTFEEYKIEPRFAEDIVVGFINGINEFRPARTLGVYPNPAQYSIRLDSNEPGLLVISDAMGREVSRVLIQEALPTVDVSALSAGMYHVQFTSQAGRATSKLHIQ
jgi:hypothetical protein